jgi:cytochrome c peroxidase
MQKVEPSLTDSSGGVKKGMEMVTRARLILSFICLRTLSWVSLAATLTGQQQLGKHLFFDRTLSLKGNQACSACHGPDGGWTGPDQAINRHGAVYEGSIPERFGNPKPPSAAYASFSPVLSSSRKAGGIRQFQGGNFWDGRTTGKRLGNPAADQAQGPFRNPLEQALPDASGVVSRVCLGSYSSLFLQICGQDAHARKALGKFKAPTLRNVDKRPGPDFGKPYSHNGFFKSLKSIVHFYNTRDVLPRCPEGFTEAQALANNCWPSPETSLNLNTEEMGNLGLTPEEEDALVAFLKRYQTAMSS